MVDAPDGGELAHATANHADRGLLQPPAAPNDAGQDARPPLPSSVKLNYGRLLDPVADEPPGYRLEQLAISSPDVVALSGAAEHPVAVAGDASDAIAGTRFALTASELAATDRYEAADHVRVRVVLGSGVEAWLYVAR